jgi:hypothetical protein
VRKEYGLSVLVTGEMERNYMTKNNDDQYTDDDGEMAEVGAILADLLPTASDMSDFPVHLFETLPDGTERTVGYRYGGNILTVRLEKPDSITLEFDDGRTIQAHLAKNFHLFNQL